MHTHAIPLESVHAHADALANRELCRQKIHACNGFEAQHKDAPIHCKDSVKQQLRGSALGCTHSFIEDQHGEASIRPLRHTSPMRQFMARTLPSSSFEAQHEDERALSSSFSMRKHPFVY
eukprot:1158773-Pelagomonas_calceolata.AAC.20